MLVRELIDFLHGQPGDAEIELAIIAPVTDGAEDITVDRYPIAGALPWQDDDDDEDGEQSDEGLVIWLIGGDDDDVEQFIDAIEDPDPSATD